MSVERAIALFTERFTTKSVPGIAPKNTEIGVNLIEGYARDCHEIFKLAGDAKVIGETGNRGESNWKKDDFSGMTGDDWIKEIDSRENVSRELAHARELLDGSELKKQLDTLLRDLIPIRKRSLSEHDGEWSMDRKWDTKPFSSTARGLGSANTLTIRALCSFNCDTDADKITKYGSVISALSERIDSLGIKTKIIVEYANTEGFFMKYASKPHESSSIHLVVKDFNDYGDFGQFALSFHAAAFRRSKFTLMAFIAEKNNWTQASGLGTALDKTPIPAAPGELLLDINTVNNAIKGSSEALMKNLAESIKAQS